MVRSVVILCTYLVYLLISGLNAHAQVTNSNDAPSAEHSLFDHHNILGLYLKTDFTQLITKKSNIGYLKAECALVWHESDSTSHNVRVKPRGKFRKEQCYFPPLMLNFKPDSLRRGQSAFGKIKLVSPCQRGQASEINLLREYLCYRLYELFTPYSFRTRLAYIHFIDTGNRQKDLNTYAFLIEPIESLCSRNQCMRIRTAVLKGPEIQELDADRLAIFNYMIGNTDWRIKTKHNTEYIKKLDHRALKVISIPYDFDQSGFVNASYATPSEWSNARTVMDRDYIGHCRNNDKTYDILIKEFMEKEEQVLKTINDFEPLEQKEREKLIKYINAFYKELKKEKSFKNMLHNHCLENY